jgi:HlyD family secretion protein
MTRTLLVTVVVGAGLAAGCAGNGAQGPPRASGFVEAADVNLAAKVGGRIVEVLAVEGARVTAGQTLVTLETIDVDLALQRVAAERAQAVAALGLLQAGARPEEIRQAEAQLLAAKADLQAAQAELDAARLDAERFEQLIARRAGAEKSRDDAVARRDLAAAKVHAAAGRVAAAEATVANLRAGARPQELSVARARIAAIDAEIARLHQNRADAVVTAPSDGIVTTRLVEPGELVAPGTPLVVIVDLDHAWANVYVEEPVVPALRVGQPAVVLTDAGDRLDGRVAFISPRAEFTPRNVQTAAERARLVYRVKVTVDNREGVLKPGMPVEAEFPPQ